MAVITVVNNNDSGAGSLRAAIAAADSGDTIVFSPGMSGSIITLASSLILSKGVTIDGSEVGQNVVVSGGGVTTVFDVTGSGVTLDNLAISNGKGLGATGTSATGGNGGNAAGGIHVEAGATLTLDNDTFLDNHATGGKGTQSLIFVPGNGGSAAGAYYVEAGAAVSVSGLSFFGNSAQGGAAGGGFSETGMPASPGIGYPITNYGFGSGAPCFCWGTLIGVEGGERPVEQLGIGDRVMTADGLAEPILWIGRRSYAGRFLAANPAVMPVLIRAGALGDGLPRRDLRVSPCHAMYLDGVLVPAAVLVNRLTIIAESGCRAVDYYHIELASQAVILAEGAPTESFVDHESRALFHNIAEFNALYPGGLPAAEFVARRVECGFELQVIRNRLSRVMLEGARAA